MSNVWYAVEPDWAATVSNPSSHKVRATANWSAPSQEFYWRATGWMQPVQNLDQGSYKFEGSLHTPVAINPVAFQQMYLRITQDPFDRPISCTSGKRKSIRLLQRWAPMSTLTTPNLPHSKADLQELYIP